MGDRKPKHASYADYVIRNGRLIGDFEKMYRDHDDPWHQLSEGRFQPDKALALNAIRRLNEREGAARVLEIGCGLGAFTNQIAAAGVEAYGLEVSETAVRKAGERFPAPTFIVGDILDEAIYHTVRPDVLVMSETTWYVLDKLDRFKDLCRNQLPGVRLIHILTVYPENEQQYGLEYFRDFDGIKRYFEVAVLEQAEISSVDYKGTRRTYFLGHWPDADWDGGQPPGSS